MAGTDGVDVAALRRDYHADEIDERAMSDDPVVEFRSWLEAAVEAGTGEPNAMVLATVGADGTPSARTVLLKSFDDRGFGFFTNRTSRKAGELHEHPSAALVFAWLDLQRQVEVAGPVETMSDSDADRYFAARPRASQLGAWASHQSSVIADRSVLDDRWARVDERFAGGPVPRPPFWGGYRVVPMRMEFWQGRASRLHDRIRYRRETVGEPWTRQRLAP